MKTTLDLPGDLVREIKLRAVHDGRKLKDTVADLLRRGLRRGSPRTGATPKRVKLPLVQCRRAATLTPHQMSTALEGQDTEWHREAARR